MRKSVFITVTSEDIIMAKAAAKKKPAPKEIHLAPTLVRVTRTIEVEEGTEFEDDTETIEIHKFVTTPASASVEIPIKMSKHFNSIGITVGVTVPCYTEELELGIEKAKTMAMEKVFSEIPGLKESLENLRG